VGRLICKTEALILRGVEFRETSKILVAFTRDYGKVRLVARGARRPGSKFGGALEVFTRAGIIFYRREGRDIYTLSEATMFSGSDSLTQDAVRMGVASAGLELVEKTTPWESPSPRLFALLVDFLSTMESSPRQAFRLVYLSFMLKLSAILGHGPELETCLRCRKSLPDGAGALFNVPRGGLVCLSCARGEGKGFVLAREGVRLLRVLQGTPFAELLSRENSGEALGEVVSLIRAFFEHHSDGQAPRQSFAFLSQLEHTHGDLL